MILIFLKLQYDSNCSRFGDYGHLTFELSKKQVSLHWMHVIRSWILALYGVTCIMSKPVLGLPVKKKMSTPVLGLFKTHQAKVPNRGWGLVH